MIFGQGAFAYSRFLRPLWGDLAVLNYEMFDAIDIVDYVTAHAINRVIFTNPYANERRLAVYNKVRQAGIAYVVVERGALTDSMFIDDTGFCCESTRYGREHWPERLNASQLRHVEDYIAQEMASSDTLEKQGERIGGRCALDKMGIPNAKRIIFVPFQSRSDTTVNYFAGDIGSYDAFVNLVREVVQVLPDEWTLVYKNHPLSLVEEHIPGAFNASRFHIKDILDVCDYVLLMNSGVGVLSILFGKPCMYTAKTFYADEMLNRKVLTARNVLEVITSDFAVDQDSRLRFIYYLINHFYSFGKFTVSEKTYSDKAKMTVTERIDYYKINYLGGLMMNLSHSDAVKDINAPVYDIFREWLKNSGCLKNGAANKNGKAGYRKRWLSKWLVLPEKYLVKCLSTERKYEKYLRDRSLFFTDSSFPLWRAWGEMTR